MRHEAKALETRPCSQIQPSVLLRLFLSAVSESSVFRQAELQKLRQQALETKHFIEKQEVEERKLLRIIAEADGERVRQKKELDQVGTPSPSPPLATGSPSLFASHV